MTINYDSLADTAKDLISGAGKLVEIKRYVGRTIDKVTQASTPGIIRSFRSKAVILPTGKGTIQGFDNKSLQMTSKHQRFLIVSAKAEDGKVFVPAGEDVAVFDGFEWTIAGCTPVCPGGADLIYRIGCFR